VRSATLIFLAFQQVLMDSSAQEVLVLRLEQEDWIRDHIGSLDELTLLDRAAVKKLYEYQRGRHTIHVRHLARVLGCSAMGASKTVRRLEKLRIVRSHRFGYRREKFLSLDTTYPIWLNIVLRKLGLRASFSDELPVETAP